MRFSDEHDRRKWNDEQRMIDALEKSKANELETVLARIAALESELERLQAVVGEQDHALIEKILRP